MAVAQQPAQTADLVVPVGHAGVLALAAPVGQAGLEVFVGLVAGFAVAVALAVAQQLAQAADLVVAVGHAGVVALAAPVGQAGLVVFVGLVAAPCPAWADFAVAVALVSVGLAAAPCSAHTGFVGAVAVAVAQQPAQAADLVVPVGHAEVLALVGQACLVMPVVLVAAPCSA